MLKMLFDLTALQPTKRSKFHGGGEYARFVFNELVKNNLNFDAIFNPDIILPEEIKLICQSSKIKLHEGRTKEEIYKVIEKNNYSHFYSALPYRYTDFSLENVTFIMVIHGLRALELPKIPLKNQKLYLKLKSKSEWIFLLKGTLFYKYIRQRAYSNFKKLVEVKNKIIITVSSHTKYSLLTQYPNLKASEIEVCNAPMKFNIQESIKDKTENKYFLLISGNRMLKNNHIAIQALDELMTNNQLMDTKVVVLGIGDNKKLQKVKNKTSFKFLDYVSYEELDTYFKYAFCFIYPTLNEGFGYPPIQAMQYGSPVIASSFSSVPEVCQNAVLYFNPLSKDELKNRILNLYHDKKLYSSLQTKSLLRVKELENAQNDMLKEMIKILTIK